MMTCNITNRHILGEISELKRVRDILGKNIVGVSGDLFRNEDEVGYIMEDVCSGGMCRMSAGSFDKTRFYTSCGILPHPVEEIYGDTAQAWETILSRGGKSGSISAGTESIKQKKENMCLILIGTQP